MLAVPRVVALGQQHVGADVHRLAPELGQQITLDLDVLHMCRIGRVALLRRAAGRHGIAGLQHLVELEVERAARHRVEMQQHRRAHQVARRDPEVVAVTTRHVQRDDRAVGAVERRVDVEQRLHVVVAGRQLVERGERVAVDVEAAVQSDGAARRHAGDVLAPERRGVGDAAVVGQEPRLVRVRPGHDDEQAPVNGRRAHARVEGDVELERPCRVRRGGLCRVPDDGDAERGDGQHGSDAESSQEYTPSHGIPPRQKLGSASAGPRSVLD